MQGVAAPALRGLNSLFGDCCGRLIPVFCYRNACRNCKRPDKGFCARLKFNCVAAVRVYLGLLQDRRQPFFYMISDPAAAYPISALGTVPASAGCAGSIVVAPWDET